MANHYVTFGMNHNHQIGDHTLNHKCVALFQAPTSEAGREKAFKLFGDKFSFEYHDKEFNMEDMKYYPGGLVII